MAETVLCGSDALCNCACNCHAYLAENRSITVGDLEIDGNNYTFKYTITNESPSLSFVVFCVQCPTSEILISASNTAFVVTGNPNGTPVVFTQCFTPGCESELPNRFYVDYEISNELCCRYQGFKIDINPAETITEIEFAITFTLPEELSFGFSSGNLKLKTGQIISIVNDLCMPGCTGCCMQNNICEMWMEEKDILESNEKVFTHLTNLLLPPELDLSTITVNKLESIIRSVAKLEKSSANLICNVAKVLEQLNELKSNACYLECTQSQGSS